jgi:hypothetical protein
MSFWIRRGSDRESHTQANGYSPCILSDLANCDADEKIGGNRGIVCREREESRRCDL